MVVSEALAKFEKKLEEADIATARLDCLVLLEDALGQDRAYLLAHPEIDIPAAKLKKLQKQIEHRVQHIPLAQIRGKTEFYGREFIIDEHVLEPRPESETMLELLFDLDLPENSEVVDVGTGSGALGISAKLHLTDTKVTLIDIDDACLAVARQNAKLHGTQVRIIKSDLLHEMQLSKNTPYVLLCNLPYVPNNYEINRAALNEPRLAIFGGEDGLNVYRQLIEQIVYSDIKSIYLCCESLPFQHKALRAIAEEAGYKQLKEDDFIQIFQQT